MRTVEGFLWVRFVLLQERTLQLPLRRMDPYPRARLSTMVPHRKPTLANSLLSPPSVSKICRKIVIPFQKTICHENVNRLVTSPRQNLLQVQLPHQELRIGSRIRGR